MIGKFDNFSFYYSTSNQITNDDHLNIECNDISKDIYHSLIGISLNTKENARQSILLIKSLFKEDLEIIFSTLNVLSPIDKTTRIKIVKELSIEFLTILLYNLANIENENSFIPLVNFIHFNQKEYIKNHEKMQLYLSKTKTITDGSCSLFDNDCNFIMTFKKTFNDILQEYNEIDICNLATVISANSLKINNPSIIDCNNLSLRRNRENFAINTFLLGYKHFLCFNLPLIKQLTDHVRYSSFDSLPNLNYHINEFIKDYKIFLMNFIRYIKYFDIEKNKKTYYLFLYQLYKQLDLPFLLQLSSEPSFNYHSFKKNFYFDKNIRFGINQTYQDNNIEKSIVYKDSSATWLDSDSKLSKSQNEINKKNNAINIDYSLEDDENRQDFYYLLSYTIDISNYGLTPSLKTEILKRFVQRQYILNDLVHLNSTLQSVVYDIITMARIENTSNKLLKIIPSLISSLSKSLYFNDVIIQLNEIYEKCKTEAEEKEYLNNEQLFKNYKNLLFFFYQEKTRQSE